MYYIKLENEDCDNIVYYCRNCGNSTDSLLDLGKCVLKESINKNENKLNITVNKYTKLDNSLPRINYIKCPNEVCESNKESFDINKREIISIRYDHTDMKYLYLCSHCDYTWKTDK
tara:strand:+ start:2703 stop:3050 length:348 start_codon:yes stop_codon:yes gene_type:complete